MSQCYSLHCSFGGLTATPTAHCTRAIQNAQSSAGETKAAGKGRKRAVKAGRSNGQATAGDAAVDEGTSDASGALMVLPSPVGSPDTPAHRTKVWPPATPLCARRMRGQVGKYNDELGGLVDTVQRSWGAGVCACVRPSTSERAPVFGYRCICAWLQASKCMGMCVGEEGQRQRGCTSRLCACRQSLCAVKVSSALDISTVGPSIGAALHSDAVLHAANQVSCHKQLREGHLSTS